MANDLTVNPIFLDTASGGTDNNFEITAIAVNASADSWEVVLKDHTSGATIFHASSALVNHRYVGFCPAKPISVTGIYPTTLTNITDVLVYVDK